MIVIVGDREKNSTPYGLVSWCVRFFQSTWWIYMLCRIFVSASTIALFHKCKQFSYVSCFWALWNACGNWSKIRYFSDPEKKTSFSTIIYMKSFSAFMA